MPCNDSSSGFNLYLDEQENFVRFEFAKATCSSEIQGQADFNAFCQGKTLEEILDLQFSMIVSALDVNEDEEGQFVLHLQWEAFRSVIAKYLGIDRDDIDDERCLISSIEYEDDQIIVGAIILPPQEMPKIIPCSKKRDN